MSKIKITNIKVYRPSIEVSVTETKKGLKTSERKTSALAHNFNVSDFIEKSELEKYRAEKRSKHQLSDEILTVLLCYEEVEQ